MDRKSEALAHLDELVALLKQSKQHLYLDLKNLEERVLSIIVLTLYHERHTLIDGTAYDFSLREFNLRNVLPSLAQQHDSAAKSAHKLPLVAPLQEEESPLVSHHKTKSSTLFNPPRAAASSSEAPKKSDSSAKRPKLVLKRAAEK